MATAGFQDELNKVIKKYNWTHRYPSIEDKNTINVVHGCLYATTIKQAKRVATILTSTGRWKTRWQTDKNGVSTRVNNESEITLKIEEREKSETAV